MEGNNMQISSVIAFSARWKNEKIQRCSNQADRRKDITI